MTLAMRSNLVISQSLINLVEFINDTNCNKKDQDSNSPIAQVAYLQCTPIVSAYNDIATLNILAIFFSLLIARLIVKKKGNIMPTTLERKSNSKSPTRGSESPRSRLDQAVLSGIRHGASSGKKPKHAPIERAADSFRRGRLTESPVASPPTTAKRRSSPQREASISSPSQGRKSVLRKKSSVSPSSKSRAMRKESSVASKPASPTRNQRGSSNPIKPASPTNKKRVGSPVRMNILAALPDKHENLDDLEKPGSPLHSQFKETDPQSISNQEKNEANIRKKSMVRRKSSRIQFTDESLHLTSMDRLNGKSHDQNTDLDIKSRAQSPKKTKTGRKQSVTGSLGNNEKANDKTARKINILNRGSLNREDSFTEEGSTRPKGGIYTKTLNRRKSNLRPPEPEPESPKPPTEPVRRLHRTFVPVLSSIRIVQDNGTALAVDSAGKIVEEPSYSSPQRRDMYDSRITKENSTNDAVFLKSVFGEMPADPFRHFEESKQAPVANQTRAMPVYNRYYGAKGMKGYYVHPPLGTYMGHSSHPRIMNPPFPVPDRGQLLYGPYEEVLTQVEESLHINHPYKTLDYYYMPTKPNRKSALDTDKAQYVNEPVYDEDHQAKNERHMLPFQMVRPKANG